MWSIHGSPLTAGIKKILARYLKSVKPVQLRGMVGPIRADIKGDETEFKGPLMGGGKG